MHAGPPKIVESVVAVLIPPACREEVLGDLFERHSSTGQYILDALEVVPMVIMSRIRRTADPQVLVMQAFILYLSYLGTAWFQDRAFLDERRAFLRLAVPAAAILVGLILEDAYAAPAKRSPLQSMRGLVLGLAVASIMQAVFTGRQLELALPRWIMLSGSAVCLLFGSALRHLFPPVADRPVGASGPSFWLKHLVGEQSEMAGAVSSAIKGVGLIVAIALLGAWVGGSSLMMSLIWLSAFILLMREWRRRG